MPLPLVATLGAAVFGRTLLGFAARLFASLGIGFTVLQGVNLGFEFLIDQVQESFTGIPSDLIGLVAIAGADKFMSLVLSAYVTAVSLKGISGTIKRMVFK